MNWLLVVVVLGGGALVWKFGAAPVLARCRDRELERWRGIVAEAGPAVYHRRVEAEVAKRLDAERFEADVQRRLEAARSNDPAREEV